MKYFDANRQNDHLPRVDTINLQQDYDIANSIKTSGLPAEPTELTKEKYKKLLQSCSKSGLIVIRSALLSGNLNIIDTVLGGIQEILKYVP
jgi:hypothetical protein